MVELVVGDMGLSIPTDEAIRQLELKDTERVDGLYVNLHTLVRNAMGSTDTTRFDTVKQVSAQVIKDIFLIHEHMRETHELPVMVYYCDYTKHLPKERGFSQANFKLAKTDKQIQQEQFRQRVMDELLKLKELKEMIVEQPVPLKPPKAVPRTSYLILTHVMVDLIDYHYFDKLTLLESHTGALKASSRFHQKLNVSSDKKDFVPFNSITLQVFGDNSKLFEPVEASVRRAFTDLAVSKRLNPNTTVDRVKFCLNEQSNQALKPLTAFYR